MWRLDPPATNIGEAVLVKQYSRLWRGAIGWEGQPRKASRLSLEVLRLKGLEKYNLKRFCKKHDIDVHEIDDTLTYSEVKEHLSEFTLRSAEDLAKDAKSQLEWYESLSLGERYGDIETSNEMPLLIIECFIKYSQRMTSIVRLRLKPYRKHIDMTHKGYLIIKGQIREVSEILRRIDDVPNRIVGRWLVYDWERLQGKWQYIPIKGWVRKQN